VKIDRADWLAGPPSPEWTGCMNERPGDPLSYLDRVPSMAGFGAWEPHEDYWYDDFYYESGEQDPGFQCPPRAPLPLTNEKTRLLDYLDGIELEYGTCADIGLAWGVRTLSPDWKGLWGDPDTPSTLEQRGKAIVLMTDGQSAGGCTERHSGSTRTTEILLSYCSALKAEGWLLVTVAIDTPASVQDMLRACASPGAYFYEVVDWSRLPEIASGIAADVGGGKVRRIQ